MSLSASQKRQRKVKAKAQRLAGLKANAGKSRTIQARAFNFSAPVKIAAAEGEGKRRTYRVVANTGAPMNVWPFELPVVIDLPTADISAQRIPALYSHMPDERCIVGQNETLTIEGGNLIGTGYFTPTEDPDDYGRRVLSRADAGYQWQVSVGADPASMESVEAGKTGMANGREYPGPCLIARGCVIRELSFVVLGGDRHTSAVVAKHKGKPMSAVKAALDFEQWCVSKGFEEPDKLTETQRANLQQMYDDANPGDEEEPEAKAAEGDPGDEHEDEEEETPTNATAKAPKVNAMKEQRKIEAAERARVNGITRLCAAANTPVIKVKDEDTDLAAHAIEQGWTEKDTAREIELIQLRAGRATPPASNGPHFIISSQAPTAEALEAAVLLRAGGRVDQTFRRVAATHYLKMPGWIRAGVNDPNRAKIMDVAHKFSSFSMVDLARECCKLDGHTIPDERSELFATALKPSLRAASSGSTLTRIFTTSVNALLLSSYEQSEDTTAGWVSETDVQNYQSQERARIDIGAGLKKRARGKTAEHADYTDSYEAYKIADYAKMFEIDDQDFIDDNLGGLKTVPTDMGKAAARLRPDLVYSIILDNPTLTATSRQLFNTTDGSLASSAAALSMATLTVGVKSMRLFRENSVNLNLKPTHLIVGPENELLAMELVQSVQILYGADDETVRGNMNAMAKLNITPVSEARLSNGLVDPSTGDSETGSTTAWYLACADAHTIEVGYLAGTGRGPKVRSYVLDKGRYGMGWDVQMSIGAKALDWKGLFKNAGQ